AHAPAAERPDRGRRAAPRPARPDADDAEGARAQGPRPPPCALDPADLARRLVLDPPGRVLQLGAAHRLGPEHRARHPDRRGAPLLVADRQRPALAARRSRLPRRRVRRLVLPRARLHLLEPRLLLVLRARAAALGTLACPRPEPRRDRDERRADARLPPRD